MNWLDKEVNLTPLLKIVALPFIWLWKVIKLLLRGVGELIVGIVELVNIFD